ncbi:YggS family pyridoxal phosphate-dependent enzyme [Adlercreutzia sp. ZJ138]|uniref:YggS family pyridoxal phosphate-dependent enzyme n=1 Tax=Adlercreutzia sp. ZJ138 TaxID=2709405 RepID=UPI0013EA782D|nr:YggS family pyridoxal phosphate-dependent enzyme [Adlercreutzia sp. ZJ138]
MGFAQRYNSTLAEVAACCAAVGRDASEVRVLAVSKTVGPDDVALAVRAGAHDFGENRPDAIMAKHDVFPNETWHFIGNIQSRRIPDIVRCASLIHSLDNESHARKINDAAASLGKVQDVLIEVNVSGEESKGGLAPDDVFDMVALCTQLPCVRVRGLMTMAPQGDASVARQTFDGLASLHQTIRSQLTGPDFQAFNDLSMGMSEDWREAVAAGATIIRIGRALFSDEFDVV